MDSQMSNRKNEVTMWIEDESKREDWKSELPHEESIPSWWMKNEGIPVSEDTILPKKGGRTVTIVGTGITGTSCLVQLVESLSKQSCLHDLARNPLHLVLIDARSFCSGATGRNGGHLYATTALQIKTKTKKYNQNEAIREMKLEQRSIDRLMSLIKEQGWKDSVDLTEGGNVHLFDNLEEQSDQLEELEFAKSLGIDLSHFAWLDPLTAVKEYDLKSSLTGALKIPGNNLFPLKLVKQMYNLAKSKAASIDGLSISLFTNTRVLKITRSEKDESNWLIQTSKGNFESQYIIHATNAYASYLLPQFNAQSSNPIVPTRAQVVAIQPSASDGKKVWTNAFSANEGFDYFFQRPVNTVPAGLNPVVILGGGRNRAPPRFEFGTCDDSKLNQHVGNYLRNFLPAWFPNSYSTTDGVDVVHEWPGIMGFTKDHDPIVGQLFENGVKLDGQYISAGYSGHGMSRAPGCAEVVTSMIITDMMKQEWTVPDWFPLHYLTTDDRFMNKTEIQGDSQ